MSRRITITTSHSTLTEAAREAIEILERLPEVSKVSIGIIKVTKSKGGKRDIKFLPITGGVKAVVRGSGTVQELYIYTKEAEATKTALLSLFRKN